MTEGQDRTGLGPLRLPIFLGMAIFALSQAIASFNRAIGGRPTEIIANENVTLITRRSGGLMPNGNLVLEIIFGISMLGFSMIASIGFVAGLHYYLTKKDEKVIL